MIKVIKSLEINRWVTCNNPILLLALTAFIFNASYLFYNYYDFTYDNWSHMFYASHYMNSWFDTYDPRWFGGISVTSYAPLVTQIIALGGFVIGLEKTSVILTLGVMITLPISVYYFCKNFLSSRKALLAGFISIFLPSIYIASYYYGQLPSMFALTSCLFMGAFLWKYFVNGKFKDIICAGLLLGITSAAHQFTIVCFAPDLPP